jgi:hypothetical protein
MSDIRHSDPPPVGTPVEIVSPGYLDGITGVVVGHSEEHAGPDTRARDRDGAKVTGRSCTVRLYRPYGSYPPQRFALARWAWDVRAL